MSLIHWWVDASFVVHPNFKSHTGSTMLLRKASIVDFYKKQKVNTDRSTTTKLMGSATLYIAWNGRTCSSKHKATCVPPASIKTTRRPKGWKSTEKFLRPAQASPKHQVFLHHQPDRTRMTERTPLPNRIHDRQFLPKAPTRKPFSETLSSDHELSNGPITRICPLPKSGI